MSDYCAFLSNCLAIGEHNSQRPDGSSIRDKIEWKLNNYEVILLQNEDMITQPLDQLRNRWIASSRVIIKNVTPPKVGVAENIARDLASMLHFAGMSQVHVFGNEYPMGSGNRITYSTTGIAKFFRPTFDVRNGTNLKSFVDQCWRSYIQLKQKRKLNIVFEMLTASEATLLPLEFRLASVFIALENLKDTYARSNNIPYVKGYFRKISSPPKHNLSKERKYTFEELLTLMLREVKIRKGLKRIIGLRNDIIHSGLSRRPYNSKWKTFENCHGIIRRYILKILNYKGECCSYEKPNSLLLI
ncbi:MAG: hypothetical protein NTU74_00965 [Deltaproteobacteria bacterium]|nr:hypothetical protein [Deltaproteobacteria bacterium]